MSLRSYTLKEFVIQLHNAISPDEVAQYPSWTRLDEIADVSDEDLRLHGVQSPDNLKTKNVHQQRAPTPRGPKPLTNGGRRPTVRFDLTPKLPHQPPRKSGSSSPPEASKQRQQQKQRRHSEGRRERLSSSSSSPSPPPPSPPSDSESHPDRLVVPLGTLIELDGGDHEEPILNNAAAEANLRRLQLADLIPPDLSVLDQDSHKLFVPTPSGEQSDSVSYFGSSSDED